MYPYLGNFATGATIFFPFATYSSAGASVTLTGLAVTDIEVYKGASMTQRASDAGYALVDTDGIDIDGITGIHGFTIDTSDNTDAGFYAAGNDYTVVVLAVTVDSQTVNFIAGRFSIENRSVASDVTKWNGTAVATPTTAGVPEVDVTYLNGSTTELLKFLASASTIIRGTVDNAAHTPTTTEFEADDITTAAADHYNGRLVIFTSGTLLGQAARINDYAKVGSNGHFTVSTLTSAPANNDTFCVV